MLNTGVCTNYGTLPRGLYGTSLYMKLCYYRVSAISEQSGVCKAPRKDFCGQTKIPGNVRPPDDPASACSEKQNSLSITFVRDILYGIPRIKGALCPSFFLRGIMRELKGNKHSGL